MAPSKVIYTSNAKRKALESSPSKKRDLSQRSASSNAPERDVKRRKAFVMSEDEEIIRNTPSIRSESPEIDFPSTSATRVNNLSDEVVGDSDEEVGSVQDCVDENDIPAVYKIARDEITEDANLQIIGETDPREDCDSDWEDDDDDSMPVRLLKDFTVYNMDDNTLVHIAELIALGPDYGGSSTYGASGIVEPYVDDDEEDEDEDDVIEEDYIESSMLSDKTKQTVKLSTITEFNIHDISRKGKKLNSKMYLHTKFAWYILDTPSVMYSPFFNEFWLRHRMLHLVVSASQENPRITYDQFIRSLKISADSSDAVALSMKILGRELTKDDVESDDVKFYVISTLDDLRVDGKIKLDKVPLIRNLRGQPTSSFDDDYHPARSSRKKPALMSKTSNPEKEVLQHRNDTVVTPLVGRVAATFFDRVLSVAGQLEADPTTEDSAAHLVEALEHHSDPESIEWLESASVDGFYQSVEMDGVTYSVGDAVMVMPGHDEDRTRRTNADSKTSQTTTNTLGNTMWFCKICYMYEINSQKLFHGQWYQHGSKTLLQETANPQSLFLIDDCEPDIPLASIYQKCNLRELSVDEDEPADETSPHENNFYHGLTWIQHDQSLVQLNEEDVIRATAQCEEGIICISCGLKREQSAQLDFRIIPPRGFFQRGEAYHVNDFVYILPSGRSLLLKIGQITRIKAMEKPPRVTVRVYGRFDSLVRKMGKKGRLFTPLASDERRLFKTDECININADLIHGKCFVRHLKVAGAIDRWVQSDDHFFVNQCTESKSTDLDSVDDLDDLPTDDFGICTACHDDRVEELARAEGLLARHGPLRGLELYSGAGGLGTGFDASQFVETKWAVEFSPSASLTYEANHPDTTVYNQCSNLLLDHAISTHKGKNPPPLRSIRDKKALPPMPKPDEVDFIYGGPPCQSFSGANHHKKANDIRSTLICNMLSYVEHYRPSYFLLENVIGLLSFPLKGRMVGKAFVKNEGIRMGVCKFIIRTLTCLGYQARFKVLQAGQYGAPQGRKRVLFWGAKRGLPLPKFPAPTHAFHQHSLFVHLATGDTLAPVSRSRDPSSPHQCAPFHAVTINDATGDLPPFDWKNPHELIKSTPFDVSEAKSRRQDLGIPSFGAVNRLQKDPSGFWKPEPYAHKPLNRYQRAMRARVADGRVKYQYTRCLTSDVVERTVTVPLEANAYHDDLPKQLLMNPASRKGSARNFIGLFGRLDGNGFFRTAMTVVRPNAKGGELLHPWQKRIVSVQECARAQGFPDHYFFHSVNKGAMSQIDDQLRQIGNAVPVPLALALGKALGEALLKTWEEEDRAGSPEL